MNKNKASKPVPSAYMLARMKSHRANYPLLMWGSVQIFGKFFSLNGWRGSNRMQGKVA